MNGLHFLTFGETIAEFVAGLCDSGATIDAKALQTAIGQFAWSVAKATGQVGAEASAMKRALRGYEARVRELGVVATRDVFPDESLVQIIESDVRTVAGGSALIVTFGVIAGQYAGRRFSTQVDLKNDDPETEAVGLRNLATLFELTNTPPSRRSEDLHRKPLLARLAERDGDLVIEAFRRLESANG